MIVREFYKERTDSVKLYRTYSDKGVYIRKVGTEEIYTEAVDIEEALHSYEETDTEIEEVDDVQPTANVVETTATDVPTNVATEVAQVVKSADEGA